MVVSEILRLWPIATIVDRSASKQFVVNNTYLPVRHDFTFLLLQTLIMLSINDETVFLFYFYCLCIYFCVMFAVQSWA